MRVERSGPRRFAAEPLLGEPEARHTRGKLTRRWSRRSGALRSSYVTMTRAPLAAQRQVVRRLDFWQHVKEEICG